MPPPAGAGSFAGVSLPATRSVDPLRLFALLLVGGGVVAWLRERPPAAPADSCPPGVEECVAANGDSAAHTSGATPGAAAPTLEAGDFCHDVGYLCAGLDGNDTITLRRWTGHEGTLVVHVPLPDHVDGGAARTLQQAAARGVRAWNDQPFPILVDTRGDRPADIAVRWLPGMSGSRLGAARTRWSPATGLEVASIDLQTRNLRRPGQTAEPRQIRLTAAHEMGHALGLPHSDAPRDVMYPTNTATSMSAQDYRSMEVLYQVADGTTVTR